MVQMRRVLSKGSSEFEEWREVSIPNVDFQDVADYDHHFVEEFYHGYFFADMIGLSSDLSLWVEGNYTLDEYNEEYNFEFKDADELKNYQAEVDREIMISTFNDMLIDVIDGVLQFRTVKDEYSIHD